ncbi:hypothetical protein OG562_10460 [Streptomyces sp. NBC_01275]|uniref:hypothetical protein n=1 Tax=Streptomyces sp. NBC_01275 TaxID=2903807 RepID=UPI00225B4422|nr:hypothetical protein [Streptomyces sp. NBC_01275]MCX4761393.1 hypothetical protein [Streptomyces sp. NBC_01275]
MNTERPENDEGGSAEESGVEASNVEESDVGESDLPAEAADASAETADAPAEAADASAETADAPAEAADAPAASDTPDATDVPDPSDASPDATDVTDVTDVTETGAPEEADASGGVRRRSPVLIASVAAAVLLVGGGGAYLTSSASAGGAGSGAPSGDGAPAPLVLDDYSAASAGGTNGIAPGEPNPYGVTYQATGTLPSTPGSAPVYWAKGEVTKAEVADLAKALGVDGTPAVDGAAWKVGSGNDGSGPVLRVNRQAPGMWTFTRYAPGTDDCTGGIAVCKKDPAAPATAPVSEAAAKKAAAPILKAVGQDDAKIDASQIMGAQRVVNADPVIGGLTSSGWTTGISVNAQGEVVGANGQLKTPVKGDTYPLLSAREALDALNAAPGTDHRMGIGGCASPVPLKDRLESPCGSSTAAPQQETATVEHAVLGLAPHTSGGRQVLVPSWLFDVRASAGGDDYTVTQPAVDPAYLTSATTAAPLPTPTSTATSGPQNVQVDGYTVEGSELVVSFTGGVCGDYESTASESGDEVKVTVTETPWPDKVCIMIAKEYHQTVKLDEPLGSRKVVGSDGKAIPLEKTGARLPQVQ